MGHSLSLATWNCCGIRNSVPYINHLLRDCGVIVIQEHWLWSFEEDLLRDINKDYSHCSVFDASLHSESTLQGGCGGVCILWRNSLKASPIPNLSSDRICGIQLSLSNNLALHVIGTYMPSSDQSREAYVDCLNEVDSLLSRLPSNNPVVVMGDLNCHLGHLGDSRSTEEPNHRGVLWKELLDRHSLFVASLGALSMGPIHTYSSGNHSTTLDYVIGNVALAEMLQSCETLDDDPLNTSDHLPILTRLASQHQPPSQEAPKKPVRLDWDLAARDGSAFTYAAQVEAIVNPLLEKKLLFHR